jgi:serine/threonine protein kinase
MTNDFGQYKILSEIGRGGMGIVYQAIDTETDKVVAIKQLVLHNIDKSKEQEFRDRFRREAATAQRLEHPNIVIVHDVCMQTDNFFYVMEFLEGCSLRTELENRNGKFTPEDFWPVLSQVVDGLSFAHSMNVVHRDVKPDNIFLLRDGTVKITDFGIARVADFEETHLTKTGVMMGTLAYVSPEQLQDAKNVDHRADIFSLGVVTYEALSGQTPFTGDGVAQTIVKIVSQEEKPLHIVNTLINVETSSVVSKALRKKARDRYRSVVDFAREYEDSLSANKSQAGSAAALSPENIKTNADGVPLNKSYFQTQASNDSMPIDRAALNAQPPGAVPGSSQSNLQSNTQSSSRLSSPPSMSPPASNAGYSNQQKTPVGEGSYNNRPISDYVSGSRPLPAIDSAGATAAQFSGKSKQNVPLQVFDTQGKNDSKLIEPTAICYRSGKVIVADAGTRNVHVFSFDGRWLSDLVCKPELESMTGGGRVTKPSGIAMDNKQRIYICDSSDPYVRVYDGKGVFVRDLCNIQGKGGGLQGIAVDSTDLLYLSDAYNRCVQVFQAEMGLWLRSITIEDDGGLQLPSGLTTDRLNQLYCTDYGACRLNIFSKTGNLVRAFGKRGTQGGEFNVPRSVAVDNNDKIYVLDSLNHRVQVFSPRGEYITEIGERGGKPGQFLGPSDLSIDPSNALLYVADKGNHRIQVFELV